MNSDELESFRSEVFRQVEKSARIRKLLVYLGMAALFLLGMVAQYALTHFL